MGVLCFLMHRTFQFGFPPDLLLPASAVAINRHTVAVVVLAYIPGIAVGTCHSLLVL